VQCRLVGEKESNCPALCKFYPVWNFFFLWKIFFPKICIVWKYGIKLKFSALIISLRFLLKNCSFLSTSILLTHDSAGPKLGDFWRQHVRLWGVYTIQQANFQQMYLKYTCCAGRLLDRVNTLLVGLIWTPAAVCDGMRMWLCELAWRDGISCVEQRTKRNKSLRLDRCVACFSCVKTARNALNGY